MLKKLAYFLGITITTKNIRAILFVFQPRETEEKVTLDACSGWVRHMSRFFESGLYTFTLNVQLSKGNVEVFLLDKKKQPLLKFNKQHLSHTIHLNRKSKYYLQWEFESASGQCELRWQQRYCAFDQ